MSISSAAVRKGGPYTCNGIATQWPFSFKVFQNSDVLVVQTDPYANETVLVLGVDYTVSLNANQDSNPGGTVTTTLAPATGYYITLGSQVASTQSVVLTNNGGFYPTVINDALDRLTILNQQVQEVLTRAVVVPISSLVTPSQQYTNLTGYVASAAGSAAAASSSAAAASTSATSAANQATNAAASASSALTQANAASSSASSAATQASNAAASATTATTQAGIATTQANTATTQAANATTQATNAANSASTAVAALAPVTSTSTTSLTVASSGTINPVTQTGKGYVAGHPIKIAETSAAATNYMYGTVLSYNSATGAMSVALSSSGGAGTYTDWTLSITSAGTAPAWSAVTGKPTTVAGFGITDINSAYAPTLTGGGASGTWGISITGSAASATSATSATTSSYLAAGAAGQIPYQSGSGTTAFSAAGSVGQVLLSGGTGAPTWQNVSALGVASAVNLTGGSAGSVVYQSGVGTSAYTAVGTANQVLISNGSGAPSWVNQSSLAVGSASTATTATSAGTATTASTATQVSVAGTGAGSRTLTRYEGQFGGFNFTTGTFTVLHGGPRKPDIFSVILRCVTAGNGYAVGDEVQMQDWSSSMQCSSWSNSTTIGYTQTGNTLIANRSASGGFNPTSSNWQLWAYAIWL